MHTGETLSTHAYKRVIPNVSETQIVTLTRP